MSAAVAMTGRSFGPWPGKPNADRISPPGLHQSELRAQRQFQDIVPFIPGSRFLVFCRDGTVTRRSIKTANSRAARSNALRQSFLRAEFDLQFSVPHELFKSSIFADVACDYLLHLLIAQSNPMPKSSVPALLLITVRFLTPLLHSA